MRNSNTAHGARLTGTHLELIGLRKILAAIETTRPTAASILHFYFTCSLAALALIEHLELTLAKVGAAALLGVVIMLIVSGSSGVVGILNKNVDRRRSSPRGQIRTLGVLACLSVWVACVGVGVYMSSIQALDLMQRVRNEPTPAAHAIGKP